MNLQKPLLIWNVLLTAAVVFLLIKLNKKNIPSPAVSGKGKSAAASSTKNFSLAYFEMDSIESNFLMVKDVKAEIDNREGAYNKSLSELDNTYRRKIQEYQQKGSTMTQADYEKAQIELKSLEENLKNKKIGLDQQYQDFLMKRNLTVKKRIEDFIKQYNNDKGFTYIMSFEPGLFYYKDTVYNITGEVLKGLNAEYKSKKD